MEKQSFTLARQFIESGIDENYQYPLTKSYADGMTLLLYAVKWDNFDLVKLLLERRANINARAKNGRANTGAYHVQGNTMTVLMENRTSIYNLDSAVSFSGNGEVWVRVGE